MPARSTTPAPATPAPATPETAADAIAQDYLAADFISLSRATPNPARYTREGRSLATIPGGGGRPEVVTVRELVNYAHQVGLMSLDVTPLHLPTLDNPIAIFTAVARFTDGTSFSEIGDATPDNCGKFVGPHFVRMAATRAIGRVLRLALNVAQVAQEELGDHAAPGQPSGQARSTAPVAIRPGAAAGNGVAARQKPGDITRVGLKVPPYTTGQRGWFCELDGSELIDTEKTTAAEKAAYSAAQYHGHMVSYRMKDTPQALAWKRGEDPVAVADNDEDDPDMPF